MDTREMVSSVLGHSGALDARTAWDNVWQEVLARVLQDDASSLGTVHDIIPEVRRHLATVQSRQQLLGDKCASYLLSNRGPGLVFSELWCDATFQDGRRVCFHKTSKGSPQHAELQALDHVSQLQDGSRLRSVEVYMNVSPCSQCSDAILQFVESSPGVRTCLYFSSLFAHHGANHRRGLQALHGAGVRLAIFNHAIWDAFVRCVQHEEQQRQATSTVAHTQARASKRKLHQREESEELLPAQRRRPN